MRVSIETNDDTVIVKAFTSYSDESIIASACETTLEDAVVKVVTSFDEMKGAVIDEFKKLGLIREPDLEPEDHPS